MASTEKATEDAKAKGSFTSKAAWITGANFFSFILATATPFIIANILPPVQVGLYKQAFLIVATLTAMLNLQVASGAYYFIPRRPEKKFQIAINILLFYLALGGITAVSFLLYPEWSTWIFESKEIVHQVPIVGVVILLWLMSSNLESFPLANDDARTAAGFIVAAQISRSLLMIGATLIFRSEVAILWAAVIQFSLQLAMTLWYVARKLAPPGGFRLAELLDRELFKTQMINAIPYGAGGLVFTLQSDLHNYFVSHYFSPAVFAIYSVGCFQLPFLAVLTNSFTSVMIPEVARLEAQRDYRGVIDLWVGSMRKLALFFVPGCLLLFVLRREFFDLLFPKVYAEAASIFAVYLLCILMTMPLPGPILRAFEEFKFFRLKLYLALLPVSFSALYLGVKVGGLIGVIFAVVMVQALDLTITFSVIARKLGFNRADVSSLKPIARTFAAGLIAAVAVYGARTALPHHAMQNLTSIPRVYPALILMICGAIYILIYIISVLMTGALTETEFNEMAPILRRIRRFIPTPFWNLASSMLPRRYSDLDYSVK
jgi:O-antigen/teichoic acid export membrane protein